MRRPSTAQLELPLLADTAALADAAALAATLAAPDARPARECTGCGWLLADAAPCPVCRAAAPSASPRRKLPPRRVV